MGDYVIKYLRRRRTNLHSKDETPKVAECARVIWGTQEKKKKDEEMETKKWNTPCIINDASTNCHSVVSSCVFSAVEWKSMR